MILLIQYTADPVKKQKETIRRRTKSPEGSKHENSDELFQKLGDSPLQPRLSLRSSVGGHLPVDILGPHRDSELYVAITQDVPGNRMHRMPVGMRLKLRTPISECRKDTHKMMLLD